MFTKPLLPENQLLANIEVSYEDNFLSFSDSQKYCLKSSPCSELLDLARSRGIRPQLTGQTNFNMFLIHRRDIEKFIQIFEQPYPTLARQAKELMEQGKLQTNASRLPSWYLR